MFNQVYQGQIYFWPPSFKSYSACAHAQAELHAHWKL